MKGKSTGRRIISPRKIIKSNKTGNSPNSLIKKQLPLFQPKYKSRIIPKAEIDLNMNKTHMFSTHIRSSNEEIKIFSSQNFAEVSLKETRNLLIEKCKECSKICDFASDAKDIKAKSAKSALLKQIASSFSNPHISKTLSNDVIKNFLYMISKNIFRPFPNIKQESLPGFNDSMCDAAWPHISLAYSCLNAYSCASSIKEFPPRFLSCLVDNTLSPDDRERKEAKTILTNIYNKFSSTRYVIRQKCSHIFINQRCSLELLDFYYIVASSFAPPLKNETIDMFNHEILPLHNLDNYSTYYNYLIQVISRFVVKSESLLQSTFNYLIKHWPCANRCKQSLFLKEYENLVVNFENRMTKQMTMQFFRKVNECITNESADIANTALEILQNPNLHFYVRDNASNLYFMLIFSISSVKSDHWNEDTRERASSALQILNQTDPNTYKKVISVQKSIKSKPFCGISKNKWKKILDAAKAHDPCMSDLQLDDLLSM